MPNIVKQDRLAKPKFDEETQALVNFMFLYLVSDPFMNGEHLRLAAMAATKQLGLPEKRTNKILDSLMKYHRRAQGPAYGFMP